NQSPGDLCQVAGRLDTVMTTLGAVAEGSTDEHLLGAISAFTRARQAAEDAAHALRAAVGHVADYLRALGFDNGHGGSNGNLPGPTITTAPPRPSDPDAAARRLLDELPARSPRDKTRGLWVDDHGTKHPLISGQHEPWYHHANTHAVTIGLVPKGRFLSIASHVEVKFAMCMRARNITRATMVVNKIPCEREYGCHELLPRFLPEGAELTVYGPDGFRHTYHGRGQ
ncbi:MAG TPA: DddA-like double-stranded DNA deaminase toxin, partial [Mycobacteriales bacterium]